MYVTVESPLGHQPLAHVVEARFDLGLHFSCVRPIGQPQAHTPIQVSLAFRIRCTDDCGQIAEFVDDGGDLLAGQAFEPGSVRKLPFGFGAFGSSGVDPVRHGDGIGSRVERGLVAVLTTEVEDSPAVI